MSQHDDRVARIARDIRQRAVGSGHVSLEKRGVSHFVPNPHDPRHTDRKLDVRELDHILEIDVEARMCIAEPGVTFAALVAATLPHGLVPMLVPELETITLGGAVSGCAVESMSFRHGGFHDSCLAYEIVTGEGEVVRCSRASDREIFDMMHGSYGTLGILTELTFRLIEAEPFVHVEYLSFDAFEPFHARLLACCEEDGVDFVDAIVHARDRFVICVGRFVAHAPYQSSYTGTQIYYRSTRERTEDFLTTYDYLFRYDTDCHWATRAVPGLGHPLGRRLLGKAFLGSTNLLRWSERLRPLAKHRKKRLPVVIDLFIPERRFGEFYRWLEREVAYYPIWIVPYRMPSRYPWIAASHHASAPDELFIDVAVYGLENDRPGIDYSKLLEERTYELHGIKTLISENHYDEDTFWKIYDRACYDRVKARMDPQNLFRSVYEKFHFGRRVEARRPAGAQREPTRANAPLVVGRAESAGAAPRVG